MSIYSIQLKRLQIAGEQYIPKVIKKNKSITVAIAVLASLGILYLNRGFFSPKPPPVSTAGKGQDPLSSTSFSSLSDLDSRGENNSSPVEPQDVNARFFESGRGLIDSPPNLLRARAHPDSITRVLTEINKGVASYSPPSTSTPLANVDSSSSSNSIEAEHNLAVELFEQNRVAEAIEKFESIASKPWSSIAIGERALYINSLYTLADTYYRSDEYKNVERSIEFYNRISSFDKEAIPEESIAIYIKSLSCSIAAFFEDKTPFDSTLVHAYLNTLCAFEKSEIPPIVLGAYLISLSYARLLLPDEIRENDRELIDFLIRCLGKVSIYKLDEIEPCYQCVYSYAICLCQPYF
ncbi:MAG: hypothetical protein GWP59_07980 [Chlamydiales bacterium]|nr:hypothetical protein [Chlamydiales bacterium]